MENLKIRVNNEAESKEAQELFEQLGFTWAGDYPENGDWYSHLYAEKSSCCYLSPYVWGGLADRFKEITLSQLRDLVAKEKGLISGPDALRALADGEEVQIESNKQWVSVDNCQVYQFLSRGCSYKFRLKPRTITLNGIEVPAPFEPKDGDVCFVFDNEQTDGFYRFTYGESSGFHQNLIQFGAWRTEEEIKQVVAALRSILNAKP